MSFLIFGPQAIEAVILVQSIFKDVIKVSSWLNTYNPPLGASPVQMIMSGKSQKLLAWIKETIESGGSIGQK